MEMCPRQRANSHLWAKAASQQTAFILYIGLHLQPFWPELTGQNMAESLHTGLQFQQPWTSSNAIYNVYKVEKGHKQISFGLEKEEQKG